MQEEIKYIELILENCEVIRIDGEYIGDFAIENIKKSINRLGCDYIGKINKCDSFVISIYRDANVEKPIEWTMGFIGDMDKPFARLHGEKDITQINIYFNDKTEENIIVPWDHESSDYTNLYQKSFITDKGDLYIIIDKEKDIFDVWDLQELNDKDDFKWKIFGCKEDEELE